MIIVIICHSLHCHFVMFILQKEWLPQSKLELVPLELHPIHRYKIKN